MGSFLKLFRLSRTLTQNFFITKWLMLLKQVTAVYSDSHTKNIITLWGQNGEIMNVKTGAAFSDSCFYMVNRYKIRNQILLNLILRSYYNTTFTPVVLKVFILCLFLMCSKMAFVRQYF
jgi:hypothetical protein